MAKPKVFVSHSHLDDAFAEALVTTLNMAGADAWLDKEDLGAGDFQERISEALDRCEWFVLVLTREALASQWVRLEVHAANALKQSGQVHDLLFIKAGPVEVHELPALWRVYNILDATTDYRTCWYRMTKALGLAGQQVPVPRHAEGEHEPLVVVAQISKGSTYFIRCPYCNAAHTVDLLTDRKFCRDCGRIYRVVPYRSVDH